MTSIGFHGCYSPYQDERYGMNQRVFNTMKGDASKDRKQRCVVCGHPPSRKLIEVKGNAGTIRQMGGLPVKPGAWTCWGIA